MSRPTSGVRRVDWIEEGSWLACLYGPTDLDDLLVQLVPILDRLRGEDGEGRLMAADDLAAHERDAAFLGPGGAHPWQELLLGDLDEATTVDGYPSPEGLRVAVWRKVPCPPNVCGEHAWHSHELEWPEDGAPLPRGAFIGVQPWA